MPKGLTYADAGVDRELRKTAKISLKALEETYRFSTQGKVLQLPYGNIFPFKEGYLDLAIEGVGTKVLLAQLADKFDTIGVDAVAMAVNDTIRSGATPLAIVDNIHTQRSDPILIKELFKGLVTGATEAQCIIAGGEIGDVADIIKGARVNKGFDMIVSCIGEVSKEHVIHGNSISPDDVVIGLRSSGLHSNGITLARRALFKEWGGRFDSFDVPEGLDRELIYETLEPTKIYVKPLVEVAKVHRIKGAVHITGDAYLKFSRLMQFSPRIGFRFSNFRPHPIFELVRNSAEEAEKIEWTEMFKTFNMGWGFAIVVDRTNTDDVLDILEKTETESEVIGKSTPRKEIVVKFQGETLTL
ncbi:phosphoribosylformylglycinamidine cyclo-ligase [Candidatus Bathyarchaeota archaeon]|nr:phosphoribosylformylglycinamidine cyclo-ligase [Candidatus Bathyarchaeota archaeon]